MILFQVKLSLVNTNDNSSHSEFSAHLPFSQSAYNKTRDCINLIRVAKVLSFSCGVYFEHNSNSKIFKLFLTEQMIVDIQIRIIAQLIDQGSKFISVL